MHLYTGKKMASTSCWLTAYVIIHLNMFLSHEKPLYVTSPCTQLHTHTHKNTLNASVRSQFQCVCPWLSMLLVRLMLRRTWLSLGCQNTHPHTHTHSHTNNYNSIRVVLVFFSFLKQQMVLLAQTQIQSSAIWPSQIH